MRGFCKTFTEEQRKEINKIWGYFPKIDFWFDCQGNCLIYEDGVLVGKQKKDGTYIDFKKNLNENLRHL